MKELVLDTIAVYRLTKLIIEDKLTEPVRDLVFDKFPQGGMMRYLITCPWCISIWAGIVVFGLRKVSPETATYLSSILAASAVTGIAATKGL